MELALWKLHYGNCIMEIALLTAPMRKRNLPAQTIEYAPLHLRFNDAGVDDHPSSGRRTLRDARALHRTD
jgi:hypothetical protein